MAMAADQKKKLWLLSGLVLILVLAYFGLRFLPKHREIGLQSQQLAANKAELANPKYPDPPEEDVDELQEQADALVAELNALQTAMQGQMAEVGDAGNDQDMILSVSEIARANNIKVTENVAYTVAKAQPTDPKAAQNNPNQPLTKAERKRQRKAKKAGLVTGGVINNTEPEGTLIYKLVNDFATPRPMQALSLEGSFFDLKAFLQALSSMPSQVTVVRLDINTKTDVVTQGMAQLLQVKMIVAM